MLIGLKMSKKICKMMKNVGFAYGKNVTLCDQLIDYDASYLWRKVTCKKCLNGKKYKDG